MAALNYVVLVRGAAKWHVETLGPKELQQLYGDQISDVVEAVILLLMADKRCPDKVWADACKTLDTATRAVIKAANKKDVAAAGEAAKGIGKSCGGCHKAHKKKKR